MNVGVGSDGAASGMTGSEALSIGGTEIVVILETGRIVVDQKASSQADGDSKIRG
jgi:hypothetical protein